MFFLSGIVFSSAVNAQPLSSTEKKIVNAVQAGFPQAVTLLESLVNINSGTRNITGVRHSGDLLKTAFEQIGFTTAWIKMPDSVKSAGHLVAERKGKKGKRLLLLAHLDTVFEPDMPANPFAIKKDSIATGHGVLDDKGGAVAILLALQALSKTTAFKDATITVYLTGDEEIGGAPSAITRADMIQRAKQHDLALSFEAGAFNEIITSRRGIDTWRINVKASSGHSSGVFNGKNYGANYEATRILQAFIKEFETQKYLSVNPGIFSGGSMVADSGRYTAVYGKDNIIASSGIVTGDIRFLGEEQRVATRIRMKEIVEKDNLPGTSASIQFTDGIPSMEPKKVTVDFLKELQSLNEAMGLGEIAQNEPMKRGGGDISFVANIIPSLDGMGIAGGGFHTQDEWVDLKQFPVLAQRAALFIYRQIIKKN